MSHKMRETNLVISNSDRACYDVRVGVSYNCFILAFQCLEDLTTSQKKKKWQS